MGLLDFLNSDESRLGLGLLAAAGPSATPMSAGQRIQAAFQGMDAQKLEKLKSSLIQSQIDENASQNEQRKYAIQKQQELNDLLKGAFGGASSTPTSPGAFAPSIDGMGPTMPKSMAAPASAGGIGGMTADQVAMLKAKGVDFTELWKFQQEPHKMEQGSTYIDKRTGKSTYMPKVGEGMAPDANNFYDLLPGYAKAQATLEGSKAAAVEAAKAGFDPLTITPANGRPVMSTRGAVVNSMSTPQPGFGAPNGDQFAILSQELAKAEASGNAGDIASIKREIARLPKGSQTAPSASGLAGIPLQSEAEKTKLVDIAKADVVRDTADQKKALSAGQMIAATKRARELLKEGPTGSGIGELADKTANWFGASNKGAQVSSKLDIVAGDLVNNVPRMEGPQSDGDRLEYKTQAGRVADRSLPVAQRIAAAEEVERLQTKYAKFNGGEPQDAKPPRDEANKLQAFDSKPPAHLFKGKTMIGPDGKRSQSDGLIWKEVK